MSKLDIIVQGKMNRYYLGCASDVYDAETDKEMFGWTYEDEKASSEDNLKETLKLVSEMK